MVPEDPKRLAEPVLTQIDATISLGRKELTESVRYTLHHFLNDFTQIHKYITVRSLNVNADHDNWKSLLGVHFECVYGSSINIHHV